MIESQLTTSHKESLAGNHRRDGMIIIQKIECGFSCRAWWPNGPLSNAPDLCLVLGCGSQHSHCALLNYLSEPVCSSAICKTHRELMKKKVEGKFWYTAATVWKCDSCCIRRWHPGLDSWTESNQSLCFLIYQIPGPFKYLPEILCLL